MAVPPYSVFERSMPWDLIRGWIPVRVKKTRQGNARRGSGFHGSKQNALSPTRASVHPARLPSV